MSYNEQDYFNDIDKIINYDTSNPDNFNFKEIDGKDIKTFDENKELIIIPSAKRHVIRLNNLNCCSNIYKERSIITVNNLITEDVKSIALFCNEYIPDYFPKEDYIKYILNINGINYNIVPINSNKNGIKILKSSNGQNTDYCTYINDSFKTGTLSIIITTPSQEESPYISNIKIMTGGKF